MARAVARLQPAPRGSAARQLALPDAELWVFGYGSLMWDPRFPYVEWAPALVYGYHRALCISSRHWRGTPAQPGLVLGLDRGGACRGIAFRVPRADAEATVEVLWAREMKPRNVYCARFLLTRLPRVTVRALAFIANPAHPAYTGTLSIRRTAQRVATCCGAGGANIDYVARTLAHLEELGVRDHHLQGVLAAAHALNGRRR